MVDPMNTNSRTQSAQSYHPAGRLVPVLGASDGADAVGLALRLGRFAASLGETVLILDGCDGEVMERAGVIHARTLQDAIWGECALRDCLYVTANEHFSITALGDMPMGGAVGTFAALSLQYDWVFAVPESGLSSASARLAAGADATVLAYESEPEAAMRAFWMIDSIRSRNAAFDAHTVSFGDPSLAVSSALMLERHVREHLGGAPLYAGHESDRDRVETLLESMRASCAKKAA